MIVRGKEVTSNQYYGGLNRRFDRRFRLLRRLGYKYTGTVYGGMFVKDSYFKVTSIPASVVMIATNRDFLATLRSPCTLAKRDFE